MDCSTRPAAASSFPSSTSPSHSRARNSSTRSASTSTPDRGVRQPMARILLIEDSPTDTAVLTQLLERNGHHVLTSGSAEDGIEMCKRELPDLVLMDVVLPGMNGFQATRALSRDGATSAIPVLIVSTKGMDTDRAWGLRQGAKDYIVKPPNEDMLIGRINELLGA